MNAEKIPLRQGLVESLKIGNVSVNRGERKCGVITGIELCDGTRVDIPIIVVNGARDGPILLFASTALHARSVETQGIEVIRQVTRVRVDAKKLQGSIVGIPVSNPLAFQHTLYSSSIDSGSMFRVSADRPEGSTTERLANALWEQAWSKADYVIDMYSRTPENSLIYQSLDLRPPETREKLEKMSAAFGVTTIEFYGNPPPKEGPPTIHNLAMNKGVPVLLVELINRMGISKLCVETGVRGVLNVMKALEMIEGEVEKQRGIRVVPGRNKYYGEVYSNRGGIIYPDKEPGERIKKGEVIARVLNIYGDLVESIKMPVDGYLWSLDTSYDALGSWTGVQAVHAGGAVAYIFVSEEEQRSSKPS